MSDYDRLSFGKYRGISVMFVNSGYLKWLMESDWFEDKYPDDYEIVEQELNRRDHEGDHFYEDKVKV